MDMKGRIFNMTEGDVTMANKDELIKVAMGLLGQMDIGMLEKLVVAAERTVDGVKKTYGPVYKRTTAEINGKKGFLIWDCIIYNEITFQDEDGSIMSFFNSFSEFNIFLKFFYFFF